MQFKAKQIAALVGGKIQGDAQAIVSNLAKIEAAQSGDLCFLSNQKYLDFIYDTKASVVLINEDLVLQKTCKATLILVPDAYAAFALLLQKYTQLVDNNTLKGIEQPSFIASDVAIDESIYVGAFSYIAQGAQIGKHSKIYPQCYIGAQVKIGQHVTLYPGVKIYDHCIIDDYCIIHSGTVIGGDGFGFAPLADGSFSKIPQIGNVHLEKSVEIGSNCTIDRATMGTTLVKAGAKLDNLIQIAHNVEIGENTVIAAQAGIAGSSKIGKNCMIGGQAGIIGHLHIADFTGINAQSGVSKSIEEPNTKINGTPAFDYKSAVKSQAIFRHLPELQKRIIELEKEILRLQENSTTTSK